jgi:hypothetical protein
MTLVIAEGKVGHARDRAIPIFKDALEESKSVFFNINFTIRTSATVGCCWFRLLLSHG